MDDVGLLTEVAGRCADGAVKEGLKVGMENCYLGPNWTMNSENVQLQKNHGIYRSHPLHGVRDLPRALQQRQALTYSEQSSSNSILISRLDFDIARAPAVHSGTRHSI